MSAISPANPTNNFYEQLLQLQNQRAQLVASEIPAEDVCTRFGDSVAQALDTYMQSDLYYMRPEFQKLVERLFEAVENIQMKLKLRKETLAATSIAHAELGKDHNVLSQITLSVQPPPAPPKLSNPQEYAIVEAEANVTILEDKICDAFYRIMDSVKHSTKMTGKDLKKHEVLVMIVAFTLLECMQWVSEGIIFIDDHILTLDNCPEVFQTLFGIIITMKVDVDQLTPDEHFILNQCIQGNRIKGFEKVKNLKNELITRAEELFMSRAIIKILQKGLGVPSPRN